MTTAAVTGAAGWRIRAAADGDAAAVARLFEETFGKTTSEEWYRWKVLESPWPIGAPMGWLAVVGDRVVGHYGGTALRFRLGEEEVPVVHTCDAMTAPDYRRQGILSALGEAANEAWTSAGAAFVMGLPTAKWGTRSAHIGYRTAFQLGWLWRPLRAEALVPGRAGLAAHALRIGGGLAVGPWQAAWRARLNRGGRGVTVEEVERPGPEFDRLWERLRNAYDASIVRDRSWLVYRYASAPASPYQLLLARRDGDPVGYLVYREVSSGSRHSGWITDLFSAPYDPATAAALLGGALDRLRAAGCHDMRAFAAPGTPVLRALRRAGFIRRSGAYDVSVIPLAGPVRRELLNDPTRWLFAAGDSDVV